MASFAIKVPVSDVVKDMTMTVEITATGMMFFAFRCWLGCKIMRLAALIVGCGIEIKEKNNG